LWDGQCSSIAVCRVNSAALSSITGTKVVGEKFACQPGRRGFELPIGPACSGIEYHGVVVAAVLKEIITTVHGLQTFYFFFVQYRDDIGFQQARNAHF
jgi:hypothetical protein